MSYTITITEDSRSTDRPGGEERHLIFQQNVEALDIQEVFRAINKKPRKPRERKAAGGGSKIAQ